MSEYTQLRLEERKELYVMKQEGKSQGAIAIKLGRSKSTISRELNRNIVDVRIGYLPDEANQLARKRKANHGMKIDRNPELKEKIIEELQAGWSPEVIAGRQRQQSSRLRVSHETIYQFIYGKEGLALGLFRYLLKARPQRGKLFGRKPRTVIPDRVSIHCRPADVENREEFGHMEGDLTFFKGNKSINIGVVVERKTRYVTLQLNTSKHTTTVIKGIFNELAGLPAQARKSITFDNGTEFTRHTLLKNYMGMETYFCDKSAPWQKGQVEQMNVMLHRYLPKKSNISEITNEMVKDIENKLNNRPRKCLRFKTPAEAFNEELYQGVALRA